MGQKSAVTSYYLVAIGTIDEAMMQLLAMKQEWIETTVGAEQPSPRVLDILLDSILGKDE